MLKKGVSGPPPKPSPRKGVSGAPRNLPSKQLKTYVDEGFRRRPKPPTSPPPERCPKPLLDLGGEGFRRPPETLSQKRGFKRSPEPPLPKHG